MTERDDQTWLDALAGHRNPQTPASATFVEAEALRGAVLGRAAARDADVSLVVPETDTDREDELIGKARRAGLLPRAAPMRIWYAAAATIAALAVALIWQLPGQRPEIVRGGAHVQRITSNDPAALRRHLEATLRQAGIEVTGYETLGRQGLEADLPRPVPPEVQRVLDEYHLEAAPDGLLRVEIEPRQPP